MKITVRRGVQFIAFAIWTVASCMTCAPAAIAGASVQPQCCEGMQKIVIDGVIDNTTVTDFAAALGSDKIKKQSPMVIVELNSPGGSVLDAMKIGDLLRQNSLMTSVFGKDHCLSACVFILAAGVKRMVGGEVGIHRPHFDEASFSKLPLDQARKTYADMEEKARTYLQNLGIPGGLFEAMMRISSDDIVILTPGQLTAYGLEGDDPAYMEWKRARDVSSQGLENYEVGVRYHRAYAKCLEFSGGYVDFCTAFVPSEFAKELDACVAGAGPGTTVACADRVEANVEAKLH